MKQMKDNMQKHHHCSPPEESIDLRIIAGSHASREQNELSIMRNRVASGSGAKVGYSKLIAQGR